MRKLTTLVLAAGLTVGMFAKEAKVPSDTLQKIKQLSIIKNANFQIKDSMDLKDIYVLKATLTKNRKFTIFVTKDLGKVIIGTGFDKKGQKIEFLTDMRKYKKGALWTVGNGKKEYVLFTDPQCPFCQAMERNLKNLKKDVKIYVYLFPLSFHRDAKSMSKWILTQKDRAKAIEKIATGNKSYKKAAYTDEQNKKINQMIQKSVNLAKQIGVRGTPTVYDMDGRQVSWSTLLSKPPKMR